MTKTTKEKKFTAKDAVKLYTFKTDKSVAEKGYDVMSAFAKDVLKKNTMYTYKTKEFGVLNVSISESDRDVFMQKLFAEKNAKMYKKFVKSQKRVALSIKPVKK